MRFRCVVVFSVPALCLFCHILCLSFIYSFFLTASYAFARGPKNNFALLAFFFVHRCTCICFLVSFHFFGIFSQLSKIACIKSSTKLSSSFFFNLCSFWLPIWSFSEKNLVVSQILDLATLIIICSFWFLYCLDIFKKFDIYIKFVFMFVFCFVFFVHLIELMSFFFYCDFCDA